MSPPRTDNREWFKELLDLDRILKFRDRPTDIQNLNLSVEEWRVVSFVNSKNSMKAIAKACRLSDTEIRRVVYKLAQLGIVEVGHKESAQGLKAMLDKLLAKIRLR